MTDEINGTLKELQNIDQQMESLRVRVAEFEPLLEAVEEPVLALDGEVQTLKGRLQEIKVEERRLEHSADDKRSRSKKLEERLKSVRNLREEAAVRAEMDLLRIALEGDEQEALTLLDQIRKMEDRLDVLQKSLAEEKTLLEPRRLQLQEERNQILEDLAVLQSKREAYAVRVPPRDLQNYERIRGGGRSVAVAVLTPDGACGHCFGMVPLQIQNEVRKGSVNIACEVCGVLLSSGEELP